MLQVYCSGPARTNSTLVTCDQTKKGAIIDAPFGCAEHWIPYCEKRGFKIELLLLTHSHWDHTAEMALLKKHYKAPLYVHKLDARNVEDPGSDGLPLLMPIDSVKPDGYLEEGQVIKVGLLELKVLHTPGHSPGGVVFYLEKENALISGDTLFRKAIGNLSFPGCEPKKMWDSLKRLVSLPKETKVFPGHGETTTIGEEYEGLNTILERKR